MKKMTNTREDNMNNFIDINYRCLFVVEKEIILYNKPSEAGGTLNKYHLLNEILGKN